MTGIYIHIPFCDRLCNYCDFFRTVSAEGRREYPQALARELEHAAGFIAAGPADTIYIGGGTPTVYPPDTLHEIVDIVQRRFPAAPGAEITAEANPDDLTQEYASALARTPVNRLSIGIQSFDDETLRAMNRRHDARTAAEAVRNAQRAGFGNISADLIFGIPGRRSGLLDRDLEAMLSLGVQHISAYHLTIEEKTVFGVRERRGELSPVSDEESERQFLRVHEVLTAAGYEHYEVSNYALPGFRARHNSGYWHGMHYLGLGPGAHSYNGRERRWCRLPVGRYLREAGSPQIYEGELLTQDDLYNEYVMTALRCSDGLLPGDLGERFGAHKLLCFERCAARALAAGNMVREGERVRIPAEKFLVSDSIISDFFA